MLLWHREVWLIDHGASLYFHYSWSPEKPATKDFRYDASDHAMLPNAGSLSEVDAELADKVTPELIDEVLALVPDEWLEGDPARSPATLPGLLRLPPREPWLGRLAGGRACRTCLSTRCCGRCRGRSVASS